MKNTNKNKMESAEQAMPTVEVISEQKAPAKKQYRPKKKHQKAKPEAEKLVVVELDTCVDCVAQEPTMEVAETTVPELTKKTKFKLLEWIKKHIKW